MNEGQRHYYYYYYYYEVPRVISYGIFLEGPYTKMGVSFRGKKNRALVGYSLLSLRNEHATKKY
jgi:hypothetical protein